MKKRRRRIYFTQAEKAVMMERWKQGDSLYTIARLLDTSLLQLSIKIDQPGILAISSN